MSWHRPLTGSKFTGRRVVLTFALLIGLAIWAAV